MVENNNLTILMFHNIVQRWDRSAPKAQLNTSYSKLEKVLAQYRQRGPILTMDDVIDHYKKAIPYKPGSFAVTFDDGYPSWALLAAPILRDMGIPATFYIITDGRNFDWMDMVSQVCQTCSAIIGGHSHAHANLAALSDNELQLEIKSNLDALIWRNCASPIKHFAYPYGKQRHYSDKVIEKLKAYHIQCCPTAIDGINDHQTDLFELKRKAVYG